MAASQQWAVRIGLRLAKIAAALLLLGIAVLVTMLLLPREPSRFTIELTFPGDVRAHGELLGHSKVLVNDATFRRLALRVPADADPQYVGRLLRPHGQFMGTFGPKLTDSGGVNVFLYENGETWVFLLLALEDGDDLLVLPLTFDREGPRATNWRYAQRSEIWEFAWPPARRRIVHQSINLREQDVDPNRRLR